MKWKRAWMGLAALLILIFHFNVPILNHPFEMFLYKAAYIGVDLFFLLSAMSLGKKDKIPYGSFIWNRFRGIYIPFFLFSVAWAIYKKWSVLRFISVVTGAELFMSGGGAFLWFFPGIMIFYLLAPLMVKAKTRFKWKALVAGMGLWAIIAVVLQYGFEYTNIFILLNRLPIFMIGLYYTQILKGLNTKVGKILSLLVFVGGMVLLYFFGGATYRLMIPLRDLYYLVALIPALFAVLSLDLWGEKLPVRRGLFWFLGGITLELYGLQMTVGYLIGPALIKATGNRLGGFALTLLSLIALAAALHYVRAGINKIFSKDKEKTKNEKN